MRYRSRRTHPLLPALMPLLALYLLLQLMLLSWQVTPPGR